MTPSCEEAKVKTTGVLPPHIVAGVLEATVIVVLGGPHSTITLSAKSLSHCPSAVTVALISAPGNISEREKPLMLQLPFSGIEIGVNGVPPI